jgi:hypothetical protein
MFYAILFFRHVRFNDETGYKTQSQKEYVSKLWTVYNYDRGAY